MNVSDLLTSHFRLTADQKSALTRLGLKTVRDLLYYFPVRYGDNAEATQVINIEEGKEVMLFGKISGLKTSKTFRTKMTMAEAILSDETGEIQLVWFHQPYIAKMLHEGDLVKVEGKVTVRKTGGLYLSNPKVEKVVTLPNHIGGSLFEKKNETGNEENHEGFTLYPVYPETKGVTSNWMYHSLQKVFKSGVLSTLTDSLPSHMLSKYSLPTLSTALVWVHAPKRKEDAESARKRFSFEEIFYIQLHKMQERALREKEQSIVIKPDIKNLEHFLAQFPFKPTNAQQKAIDEILHDLESGKSVSRLIEGDVGSGKTLVAAATVAVMTKAGYQVAYMAPTEILAKQHFESFIQYFAHAPQSIALLTGSACYKFPSKLASKQNTIVSKSLHTTKENIETIPGYTKISKAQLLKWIKEGTIPVVIGTHALISKNVAFKKLGLVIIDEQHRFGTEQRAKLAQKSDEVVASQKTGDTRILKNKDKQKMQAPLPHLISMTATPIPRTLALTIYGDLDISIIDAMPMGRKPIITEVVLPNKRAKVYEHINAQLKMGRQAYVICPRINEPDPDKENQLNVKSVISEAERLSNHELKGWNIGILHSKMSQVEKEKTMAEFSAHKIDVLVATSVVEVGVNVPNATNIIIEGGERFGLSQLHQLRGRVIRSNDQAYCFVFAGTSADGSVKKLADKTIERLNALVTAKNGFELSELDLKLRGSGELYGGKQWGVSDLGMEAIRNIKLVEAARTEARGLIEKDIMLDRSPQLKAILAERKRLHFE